VSIGVHYLLQYATIFFFIISVIEAKFMIAALDIMNLQQAWQ
jgi:hypothetical protein